MLWLHAKYKHEGYFRQNAILGKTSQLNRPLMWDYDSNNVCMSSKMKLGRLQEDIANASFNQFYAVIQREGKHKSTGTTVLITRHTIVSNNFHQVILKD